jgi:hypothetical protein
MKFREVLMVEVEDLVVEALQCPLGDGDQADRQIQARQPGCCLDQVRQVLDVPLDLVAVPDAMHRGHQAQGLVWLDHDSSLRLRPAGAGYQCKAASQDAHGGGGCPPVGAQTTLARPPSTF